MTSLTRLAILLIAMPGLIACGGWSDGSEYAMPVFSDDGVGIAAVRHTFKKKNKVTHTATKDYQVQVLMKENTSPATPSVLTGLLPGRTIDLFFMRTEGYIILGRQTDSKDNASGGEDAEMYYDKITFDGTVTTIMGGAYTTMISCMPDSKASTSPPIRVIPSPDGKTLALYESESSCDARTQTVTFLDPASLTIISGPYDVPDSPPMGFGGGTMWSTVDMTWTQDGAFATGYWGNGPNMDSYSATLFHVDGTLETDVSLHIDCFYPKTTSSETDDQGLAVFIDDATGQVSVGTPEPGVSGQLMTFGCGQ